MANQSTHQSKTREEQSVPRATENDEQAVAETEHVDEQEQSEPEKIPLDLTFEILKNQRRRLVLDYLRDVEDGQTTIGELAEHIASIENKKPVSALSSQERKRVYIALYQSHLPKMADAGVIDYDKNRGTVSLTEHGASLCSLFKTPRRTRRWSTYYLVHMVVTALGSVVGTVLFSIDVGLIAGVFLLGYVLLVVAHAVAEYGSVTSDDPFDIGSASK